MAVAILATMALAIYRFVQSNMVAIRLSSETLASDARYDGLREVLAEQWQSLPSGKGALLGDRIRLSDHFLDPEVFIRSMGTRGHLGGLAETTLQAVLMLDAAGKDVIFIETVGAGQSEVEVIGIADTVLLVLMPGSGDAVQALKAGIMEIPDVIAINKMDNPAAKTMLNEVRSILSLDRHRSWRPPIVLTDATRGENVPELWEKIERHRAHLESEGLLEERRRKNLAGEVFAVASARAKAHLEAAVADDAADPALPGRPPGRSKAAPRRIAVKCAMPSYRPSVRTILASCRLGCARDVKSPIRMLMGHCRSR